MSGRKKHSKLTQRKKPLSHSWIVVLSKTYPDRVYFFNLFTKCSTWTNPCKNNRNIRYSESSPETLSSRKSNSSRSKYKNSEKFCLNSWRSKSILNDKNSNIIVKGNVNCDGQNSDIPIRTFNILNCLMDSPSSSVESFSSKLSSSDDCSDSNPLLNNGNKEFGSHFVTNPKKQSAKYSMALNDLLEPSTSQQSKMEKVNYVESDDGKSSKRKRTKKKKKEFWNEKKSSLDKTINNVSFKRSDKTPAQTRLLKLRKQNSEKIKELAAKYPEVFGDSSNSFNIIESSNVCKKQSNSFNDSNSKRLSHEDVEGLRNVGLEDDNCEEMDWEPSTVESDVKNINIFRQQFGAPNSGSSNVFGILNSDGSSISLVYKWFLVLDTNIFVSCLGFVKELRDTKVHDFGYPVIYVPWRVLQELDHLKDMKIDAVDRHLHKNVRKAIVYLNENFKLRHPRIIGQSFEEFSKMTEIEKFAPDDEILQTCIQFQKHYSDIHLMLLTNDKNLETKATVSGVEVYSKERFEKKFLNSNSKSTAFTGALKNINNIRARVEDNCLCEAKTILKEFLTVVAETEMKDAFEGDWEKVVVKKPPWTLQDVMNILLKHWRSVFFVSFSKNTYSEVELLYERLFKKKSMNCEEVEDIIKISQRLITSIKNSQKKNRLYSELIPNAVTKLSDLLTLLSANYIPQAESSLSTPLLPTASSSVVTSFNCRQVSENEISMVKNLFKDIWDSLRSFCCSVSDVVHSPNVSNETIVQEVKLKLSQILSEVGELIGIVEKILIEINPAEITEGHHLISYFSNFLLKVHPNMSVELKSDLPKCLAGFFSDFEGRSLLNNSLKDFREFIQDLVKANEFLNTQHGH